MSAGTAESYIASLGVTAGMVAERLAELREHVRREVEAVEAARAAGRPLIPELDAAHAIDGSAPPATVEAIHRTGCAVIRGVVDRAEAEAWDAEIAGYVATNRFRERFEDANPNAATGSRIMGVYWSRPQVLARQHPRIDAVRRFLNRLWTLDAPGGPWLDPDHDIAYPDRVRRREPGATSRGLSMHVDTQMGGGWRVAENQRVLAPLLTGGLAALDPWSPAHRTGIEPPSPIDGSVFRTFQGWTALSEMHPSDGVLHIVPIPVAAAYRAVAGLAGELGVDGDARPAPNRDAGDDLVARGLTPIPAVVPGDTVWWHGDLFHSVADASNDVRWGNVMYIGASPRCPRNDRYAAGALDRFVRGASPVDFPPEDAEVDAIGRAGVDDLSALGRAQFGAPDVPAGRVSR